MATRFRDVDAEMRGIEDFVDRLNGGAALIARVDAAGGSDAERLREAIEVVHIQHEELQTAQEELRAQVDELARALGMLQVERERYRELFEAAPAPYFVTDSAGVIREANARACHLLEHDPKYISGKPLALYMSPESSHELRTAVASAGTGSAIELAVEIETRKHERVPAQLRGVVHDGGRRILWIARREAPIDGAAPALARALRDKEELLARERQRREALEREARAKDRFLAVLSHDLRSPLNAVIGWTELLRRELLDQRRRDSALGTIERNARSMLGLVEEILDISRVTADKLQIDVRALDLGQLARRVVDALQPVAAEKHLALSATVEADVVVVGDTKRLEQVLNNLLSNAMGFTPANGRVAVVVRREADVAKLEVTDTGPGIPEEELPHLFQVFHQGEARSSKGGLGLGLYIVRQIVLLHGGHVSAASAGHGMGTTVTCELPIGTHVPAPHSSKHVLDAGDLTGQRVLVADAEEDARELMTTLLVNAGAHVASAATVENAIDILRTWRPDAVVSDLALEAADDGLGIAKAARAELGTEVAAVAVSGYASEKDVARTLAAGFDAHLAKPLGAGELVDAIVRARAFRSRC